MGTDLSVHYQNRRSQPLDSGEMQHEQGGNQEQVGARGFEPRTSSLSATRSNQLSYAPVGGAKSCS